MLKKILKLITGKPAPAKTETILIIDDVETNRVFFSRVLEKRGYKILTAVDGESGIEITRQQLPDIILLDFVMPGLQGPEVCKIIKSDPLTKHIPVLFLTSMDTPQSVINCYEEGAANFLVKPVGASELIKNVETILADHRNSQEK